MPASMSRGAQRSCGAVVAAIGRVVATRVLLVCAITTTFTPTTPAVVLAQPVAPAAAPLTAAAFTSGMQNFQKISYYTYRGTPGLN